MTGTKFQSVVLGVLIFLAGCTAASSPVGINNADQPTAGPTDEPSTPNESLSTAHFIISNEGSSAKIATVFVVQQHPDSDYFPLDVHLENGSQVTVTDTGSPPFIPGAVQASAEGIEPAGGVIIKVTRKVPAHSTIEIDIKNVPEAGESLLVIYDAGESATPIHSFSLASQICIGSQVDVTSFNATHSSSRSCVNLDDIEFSEVTFYSVSADDPTPSE